MLSPNLTDRILPGKIKRILLVTSIAVVVILLAVLYGREAKPLQAWHQVMLDAEFSLDRAGTVASFADYLDLEERLFRQQDELIYAHSDTGISQAFNRYSPGSLADPRKHPINYNRSFELGADAARGGVLLLHGMSDSPYSLRVIGNRLQADGYRVVGLRLPGHGTIPSALRHIRHRDMTAAVKLAMAHLERQLPGKPLHIVGYSNGAALAIEYSLDVLDGADGSLPASLVLISPALGIRASARLASYLDTLSNLPGLEYWAYTDLGPEFDPFKYQSFAANAADVVHSLTRSIKQRIEQRRADAAALPPMLVLKSTVDDTVTTDAVIDNLLEHLQAERHELVLFDINRHSSAMSSIVINDPAPFTNRVLNTVDAPFALTLVSNENDESLNLVSRYFAPRARQPSRTESLGVAWPTDVVSLSHVALPFPPQDPLYGRHNPHTPGFIYLGRVVVQGERGLLQISPNWLLRLRYNPFYDYLEGRSIDWINAATAG